MEENGRPPDLPPHQWLCRGVRGATTVNENTKEAILYGSRELLYTLIRHNDIHPDTVASIYFTTTQDLNVTYPATAARQFGWYNVPLLCGHEMSVPQGLARCIRILLHWNTPKAPDEIVHVYLHEASVLRPDKGDIPPIPAAEIELFMKLAQQSS